MYHLIYCYKPEENIKFNYKYWYGSPLGEESGTGFWTQDFLLGREALCLLIPAPSLYYFSGRVSHFCSEPASDSIASTYSFQVARITGMNHSTCHMVAFSTKSQELLKWLLCLKNDLLHILITFIIVFNPLWFP
jgi:hypothetical protein